MNDIRYLLSIKELLDDSVKEKLLEAACAKLDSERLQKVQGISQARKRGQSIGAGLLLQLGLQEISKRDLCCDEVVRTNEDEVSEEALIQCFTVSQIIAMLDDPIEEEYTYGEKGKPYFKNIPINFSLSHSGDYVFCVFSEQEVGADIQYKKPDAGERVVKRFFTEAEREAWKRCATQEEREELFYKLWSRKEAYGKLTGEGIVAATAVDVMEALPMAIFWQDFKVLENYHISICKSAREEE